MFTDIARSLDILSYHEKQIQRKFINIHKNNLTELAAENSLLNPKSVITT